MSLHLEGTTIVLPEYYGSVLASCAAACLLCFFTPILFTSHVRAKVFNQDFMKENFDRIHSYEVGSALP